MSLKFVINPLKIIFLLFVIASCSTLVVDNNLLEHIVESCHYEKVSLHHNPLKRLPKGNYTLMRELNNYERKDDNICIVDNHQLYYTKCRCGY